VTASATPRRVVLVDDHPIVREGLVQLFERSGEYRVVAAVGDAPAALAALGREVPDVFLLDIVLGEDSGFDLLREVQARWPELPVVVLSMHEETIFAERALRAGARGYVSKHEATEVLLVALERVLGGEVYVSHRTSVRLLKAFVGGGRTPVASHQSFASLTDRELEIFGLIGAGHGTRDIAGRLFLSIKTVEAHRARIKEKLGISTATELVAQAARWAERSRRSGPT
jgi:DNA-binding NarL/FixJ family response regulator